MIQTTYWVCKKILWNDTTMNLVQYDSDGDVKGDGGAGTVMGRLVGQVTYPFDEEKDYKDNTDKN